MVEATAVDWDSSRQAWRRRAPTGPDPFFAPMEIAMLLSRSRHLLRPTAVAGGTVTAFVLADGSTAPPAVAPPWRGEGVRRGTRREGNEARARPTPPPTPTAASAPRAAARSCSTSSGMTREENAVRDRCAQRAAVRTASTLRAHP